MNNPSFAMVTSFNSRLYSHQAQIIYQSVFDTYPKNNFFVYHENSFDQKKFNESVDPQPRWSCCTLLDLFKSVPWLESFLDHSEFSRCKDLDDYWNRNSIFWFRKIASISHCYNICQSKFLIWMDCDVQFVRFLDTPFFNWVDEHDACMILRHKATDSGFIVFNLERKGGDLIRNWLEIYKNGQAFKQKRWDDGYMLDVVRKRSKLNIGGLTPEMGAPFKIHDFIKHLKFPLRNVRARF